MNLSDTTFVNILIAVQLLSGLGLFALPSPAWALL